LHKNLRSFRGGESRIYLDNSRTHQASVSRLQYVTGSQCRSAQLSGKVALAADPSHLAPPLHRIQQLQRQKAPSHLSPGWEMKDRSAYVIDASLAG
jgi:hypothetical protein